MVDLDPTLVLALATVALAFFAAALVWTTLKLVEASRRLAKLETERARQTPHGRRLDGHLACGIPDAKEVWR